MSSTSHRPVALLPIDGAHFTRLKALLEASGVPVVEGLTADLDVAIVDLSAPSAPKAREVLTQKAPRAAILGITTPQPSVEAVVLEVVAPDAVERELVPRLAHLRARLATLKEAQQRQRDLQVLLELTARYAEATDIGGLLYGVTRRLAEEMQIDRVALVLVDGERGEGTIIAASDDAGLNNHRIELSRYPEVREVLRTGKPVIVEDAPSHPLLEDVKASVAARGIRNLAAMPLVVQGQDFQQGRYELQSQQVWVPGGQQQVWVEGQCWGGGRRHHGRGAQRCSPGHYEVVSTPGHYETSQQWVWVASPQQHHRRYGRRQQYGAGFSVQGANGTFSMSVY